ncbi:hypothetical protein BDD12DRAFT_895451 [Trichophaea hybrida]|nr:hypothetical protein BDD12DRAFT_895451 [Trichophaea hybrida]
MATKPRKPCVNERLRAQARSTHGFQSMERRIARGHYVRLLYFCFYFLYLYGVRHPGMATVQCASSCRGPQECECGDGYVDENGNWVNGDQARAQKAAALAQGTSMAKVDESKTDNAQTDVDGQVVDSKEVQV